MEAPGGLTPPTRYVATTFTIRKPSSMPAVHCKHSPIAKLNRLRPPSQPGCTPAADPLRPPSLLLSCTRHAQGVPAPLLDLHVRWAARYPLRYGATRITRSWEVAGQIGRLKWPPGGQRTITTRRTHCKPHAI
jgi:hypothetical protein